MANFLTFVNIGGILTFVLVLAVLFGITALIIHFCEISHDEIKTIKLIRNILVAIVVIGWISSSFMTIAVNVPPNQTLDRSITDQRAERAAQGAPRDSK